MLGRPSARTAARLAWGLFGLTVVAGIGGAALRISNSPVLGNDPSQPVVILLIPLFAVVGALIASRRPEHPLGWIFCALSLLFCLEFLTEQYADRGILTAPGSLPAVLPVAWVQSWMLWVFWPAGIALFLILFPTGRPLSSRWWPVAGWQLRSPARWSCHRRSTQVRSAIPCARRDISVTTSGF